MHHWVDVWLADVRADPATPGLVKNIVLVHGAFADGSSWSKVIPLLEAKGYHVTCVQNPVTSLADDVAMTRRVIALQNGPVILVGHSWGGVRLCQISSVTAQRDLSDFLKFGRSNLKPRPAIT